MSAIFSVCLLMKNCVVCSSSVYSYGNIAFVHAVVYVKSIPLCIYLKSSSPRLVSANSDHMYF